MTPNPVQLSGVGFLILFSFPPGSSYNNPTASLQTALALLNPPATTSFGSQAVGTPSGKTFTFSNNGGVTPPAVYSVYFSGGNAADFSETDNCQGQTVQISCAINVTFTPSMAAGESTYLYVKSSAGTLNATLQGTGVIPTDSLSPGALQFGNQQLNTTSGGQSVTLSNTGSVPVTIRSIGLQGGNAGEFSETSGCPISPNTLAVGSSCPITIAFTPAASGTRSTTLVVADNATTSANSIGITGAGGVPALSVSPTSVTFANQTVGTTSGGVPITLTNTGTAAVTIYSVSVGGDPSDFSATACPSSLGPGNTCTVTVSFTPSTNGSHSATLIISDNVPGTPAPTLTGVGLNANQSQNEGITTSAGTLSYNESIAQSTCPMNGQVFTTYTFSQFSFTGPNVPLQTLTGAPFQYLAFPGGTSCPAALPLPVTWSLTGNGFVINFTFNLSNQSFTFQPAVLQFSPAAYYAFGNQAVGITSAGAPISLFSTGIVPVTINSIKIVPTPNTTDYSADFSETTNCPINPGTLSSSCTVTVYFKPSSAVVGGESANLVVSDNALGSPTTVLLGGTGVYPTATLSPLTFPGQGISRSGTPQNATLTNTGSVPLTIYGISASGPGGDFTVNTSSSTCGATLASGSTCAVNVAFKPTAAGARTATLTVSDNTSTSSTTSGLSGTGITPLTTITFSNPQSGATLAGTQTLSGSAIDNLNAISSVSVAINGVPFGAASYSGSTWSFALNTATMPGASYSLAVTAVTSDSRSTTATQQFSASNPQYIQGNIDTPASWVLATGSSYRFAGWAADSFSRIASTSISIDSGPPQATTIGQPRPDVCAVYPALVNCGTSGWQISVNTLNLTNAWHTVTMTATTADVFPRTAVFGPYNFFVLNGPSTTPDSRLAPGTPSKDYIRFGGKVTAIENKH